MSISGKFKKLFPWKPWKKRKNELPVRSAASATSPNHPAQGGPEAEIPPTVSSSAPTAQGAEASGAHVMPPGGLSQLGSPAVAVAGGSDPAPVLGGSAPSASAPAALSCSGPPPTVPAQAPNSETVPSLADYTAAPGALVAPSPAKPVQAPGTPGSAQPGLGVVGASAAERPSASADPSPPAPSPAASTLREPGGPQQDPAAAARLPPTPLCAPAFATAVEPAATSPASQGAFGSGQRAEAALSLGAGPHAASLLAPSLAAAPASVAEPSAPALLPTTLSPQLPSLLPTSIAGRSESALDGEGTSPPPVIACPPSHPSVGVMTYASSTSSENLATAEDQHSLSTSPPPLRPSPLDDLLVQAFAKLQTTGIDPNKMTLPLPRDPDDKVLNEYIEECLKRCTHPRNRFTGQGRTVIFKTASFLRRFCGALGEGAALAFPAGKVVFAALEVLLRAAEGGNSDLEAMTDAFSKITDLLEPLRIVARSTQAPGPSIADVPQYTGTAVPVALPVSEMRAPQQRADADEQETNEILRKIIIDILVAILNALAVLTSQIGLGGQLMMLAKKLWQDDGALSAAMARLTELSHKFDRTLLASTHENTANLRTDVSDIRSGLQKEKDEQEYRSLADWLQSSSLSGPDPSIRLNELFDRRCPGTGEGFLFNKSFVDFEKGETATVWLRGQAGSGKSSMLAAAIKHLVAHHNANHHLTLYYFFDATSPESCTLPALLRSLAVQLVFYDSRCRHLLMELYNKCRYGRSQPSLEDLRATTLDLFALRRSADSPMRTYVVIDALDEIGADANKTITFFEALHRHGTQISLLISSRTEFSDVRAVERLSPVIVERRDVGIHEDVNLVVTVAFEAGGDLEKVPPRLQPVVKKRLLSNADLSLLWVTLQIQGLRPYAEVPMILEEQLARIPPSLKDTYKIRLSDHPHVRRLLVWMAEDAIGPVSADMLTELFTLDHSDPMRPVFGRHEMPTVAGAIHLIGTTFVTQTQPDSFGRTYIVFTHNSVKEFVLEHDLFEDERRHHSIHVSSMFAAYLLQPSLDWSGLEPWSLFDRQQNLLTAALHNWMPQLRLVLIPDHPPVDLAEHATVAAQAMGLYFQSQGNWVHGGPHLAFDSFDVECIPPPAGAHFTALSLACALLHVPLVEFLLGNGNWSHMNLQCALGCVPALLSRWPQADTRAMAPAVDAVVERIIEYSQPLSISTERGLTCPGQAIALFCRYGFTAAVRRICSANMFRLDEILKTWFPPRGLLYNDCSRISQQYGGLKRLAETVEKSCSDIDSPWSSSNSGTTVSRRAYLYNLSKYSGVDGSAYPLMLHHIPLLAEALLDAPPDVARTLVKDHPDFRPATQVLAYTLNVLATLNRLEVLEVLAPHCSQESIALAFIYGWRKPQEHRTVDFFVHALLSCNTLVAVHACLLLDALLRGDHTNFSALFNVADAKVKALATYYRHFRWTSLDRPARVRIFDRWDFATQLKAMDQQLTFHPTDPAIAKALIEIATADGRLDEVRAEFPELEATSRSVHDAAEPRAD